MACRVLDDNAKRSHKFRVDWNGELGCEVTKNKFRYIVNVKIETCTCRLWQLNGIPRAHAICALYHMKKKPGDCVASEYLKETS